MLTGSCYCGAIHYEVQGAPFDQTVCHCSICRRTTGAPCVAWFSVVRSGFRLTQGAPARFRSSERAVRSFCPRCGTQLAFERDDLPEEIDLTTCSLDEPERVPPGNQIHAASRPGWMRHLDRLPAFPADRPGDQGASQNSEVTIHGGGSASGTAGYPGE